jgi:hypothetical protein
LNEQGQSGKEALIAYTVFGALTSSSVSISSLRTFYKSAKCKYVRKGRRIIYILRKSGLTGRTDRLEAIRYLL